MLWKGVGRISVDYRTLFHPNELPRLPGEKTGIFRVTLKEIEEELEERIELMVKIGKEKGYKFTKGYDNYGSETLRIQVADDYFMYLGAKLAKQFWTKHKNADLKYILQAAKEILLIEIICHESESKAYCQHLYKRAKDPEELVRLLKKFRERLLIKLL